MTGPGYTCSECGGTFYTGRTDEEAQAEAVRNFGVRGDHPGMAIVCDDCYKAIMAQPDPAKRPDRRVPS